MTLRITTPKRVWEGHKPEPSQKTKLRNIAKAQKRGKGGK